MRIVVDAVGGDRAPTEPVAGAVMAAERFADIEVLLAGPEGVVGAELDKLDSRPGNVHVLPASESIGMDEAPIQALRGKRDSSIAVGIGAVARGEADAFVSAGNTGAVVAASTLGMGLIEGVQRPGIAVPMQVMGYPVIIIDAGANIYCKPMHLVQYGIMASVFARDILDIADPRVGLLNVGEEDRKGTDLVREGFALLSKARLNFIGNVEAGDAFTGTCDIVVCDGFAGNVLLKTAEGVVTRVMDFAGEEIRKKWRRKLGYLLCRDVFAAIKRCSDYAEYGGEPLLGVDGVTIIGHGRSDARAMASAVREARSFIQRKVNQKIGASIRAALTAGEA